MTDLEAAAVVIQAALDEHLPGFKTFGPVVQHDGRAEVSMSIDASGARAAPVGLLADAAKSDGSEAETLALTMAVIGAANVSGQMMGKFVYLRQYDMAAGDYLAAVALHLEAGARLV